MDIPFFSARLLWLVVVGGMLVAGCGGEQVEVTEEPQSLEDTAVVLDSSGRDTMCPPTDFQILGTVVWDNAQKAIIVNSAPRNCHFVAFLEFSPESRGQSVIVNGSSGQTKISEYPLKTTGVSTLTPERSNGARYDAMVSTQSAPGAARFEFTDTDGTITKVTIRLEDGPYQGGA